MKPQAFSSNSISGSIIAFGQFLRSYNMNVGMQEMQDALLAIKELDITNYNTFKFALKPLFCASPEDRLLFEKLFVLFWNTNPLDLNEKSNTKVRGASKKRDPGSLVMMGKGAAGKQDEEGKNVSGANAAERLRTTDFSKINEIDAKQLEQISDQLFKEMALRLRRRMQQSNRRGQINLRRTIRKSLNYGGEAIDLSYRFKKPKKQRLIVLLDVSGSMDKYSFFLLRFLFALREHFRQMEAFIFSTKLVRISSILAQNQLETALLFLSQQARNWSSGTKIGDCLTEFNDKYGKRLLNGSPVFIVLSDGLDTGLPDILGKELQKIRRRSKRIIWLNPLKGMKDYQPVQRGIKEALPSLDDFMSAHNLNSLLELENILSYV